MSSTVRMRGEASNQCPAFFGALVLLLAVGGCSIEAAHGGPRRAKAIDAGTTTAVRKSSGPAATKSARSAPHHAGGPPVAAKERLWPDLVGLTRAQAEKLLGTLTEEREGVVIYTPPQPGCREEILREVVTYKDGVVAAVDLQSVPTNKICKERPEW
jgi:hypothetical protein